MQNNLDPETLKIPAFMRNKAIISQSKQKLILTALDRKDAGLSPHSHKALSNTHVRRDSTNQVSRCKTPPAPLRFHSSVQVIGRPNRSSSSQRITYEQNQPAPRPAKPASGSMRFARTSRIGRTLFGQTILDDNAHDEDTQIIESSNTASTGMSFMEDKEFQCIGEITHYIDKIGVAIIMLSDTLKENETILIQGKDSIFSQMVMEMQIDRKPVPKAVKGDHIGLKVDHPAEINGKIYLVG